MLTLLAVSSSAALGDLPYSEIIVSDGSSSLDLTVKANSTKVIGATESTKVTIDSSVVDEEYIAQNGNMGEVVFARGEFTNTGTLHANSIKITNSTYYFEGNTSVDINGATSFTNEGSIVTKQDFPFPGNNKIYSYNTIEVVDGATFINNGTVTAHVSVYGENSTLIAGDGSVFNYRVDIGNGSSTGILRIDGAVTMNAELWAESGELIFTEGSSIDMKGNDVMTLKNVNLVYEVKGNVNELNPIVVSDLFIDAEISKDLVITVKGTEGGSYETTVGALTVPEPGSTTLSLLALAGLAMRRRRK
ncbi:MAG: PEP-CTERM sorting domain-containing protein [Akkermansia sp.]|nr:PEP-CTERM sorting domain-containing protein [Akkermansia sp.]